jgi:hypothetical protein
MLRFALLAALAAVSFAQNAPKAAPKPPAGVDEALRARITEFYQYHVTEEYRKAEKLVAEDSQEFYYVHNKPHYLKFEIQRITYLDNFTKAKVSTLCEQYFHGMGFEGKPLTSPSTSTWKVVDGKWYWYVDPDELSKGPFGKMANAGSKATGAPEAFPAIPTSPDYLLGKVKLDKQVLVVKPNATAEVAILNGSPIGISIILEQKLPGYEISIDKANLNSGEKAVVTITTNEMPHIGELKFLVRPLGEILALEVKR